MLRFSFLFLSLLLTQSALPQDNFIALITNPEIGADGNAENLLEVVDSINQNTGVTDIIVLGNITATGKFDEFIWAQEILDGLIPPYFVVGGEKDYFLSEGRGSEISLLWGDDKSFISKNNFSLVCLNTIIPEFPDKEFIDSETLNWFNDEIFNNKSEKILIFSYYAISGIKNGLSLFSTMYKRKGYSFVTKTDNPNNNIFVTEGFYLNRNDGWGYSLIKIKSDSLFIENISKENTKKRTITKIKFNTINLDSGNDGKSSNPNAIWEKNFSRTTITNSIFSNGNIYQGFKNGSIVCIDESGNKKWDYQANGRIYSSQKIEKDLIAAATNEGDLLTLNANTGTLVQVIGIGESITSEICVADIKEDGGTTKIIVAGTANGNLYCYNLYTLEPIWINQSANDGMSNRIISSIACADNKILFQDFNGTLYCVSALNGLLIWYWKPPVKNSNPFYKTDLIVKGNVIYLIDAAGNFHCIDALLGIEQWSIKNIYAAGLIKTDQSDLIISTNKNKLLTVSTRLGKVINEYIFTPETKTDILTDFILIDDKIVAGFSDSSIYEISQKQNAKIKFLSHSAPVVSLLNIDGNCLITNYDGTLTLLKISKSK